MSEVERLQRRLRVFAAERDWEQFHSPKNLVMALVGEAGELCAPFQWLTPEESGAVMRDRATSEVVRDEMADVAIYLLRLADVLNVDLGAEVEAKMERNEVRYPRDRARGKALKYDRLMKDVN